MSLLCIDVGNTQTVIGLYPSDEEGFTNGEELVDHWRISTNAERTPDSSTLSLLSAAVPSTKATARLPTRHF